MAESPLTTIATYLEKIYRSLPKGTAESNEAFKMWKMASDQGDARSWQDEPTVRAARTRVRKSTK